MKIGWLADNFYPDIKRGAELEDYFLIQEGLRRGHEIVRSRKPIKNVDLYIVANFVDLFNIGELLAYLTLHPYVNIEHDLRAPRTLPSYSMFAKGALINVYHSPYQREFIEQYSGKFNHFLHPMCIPDKFKDFGWERLPENEVLYIGDYNVEKGYQNLLTFLDDNYECRIWHFGEGFEKKHQRMIEMGHFPHKRMPDVYNTFSTMLFLPEVPQACSRVMAEAYLCKVPSVITNGKDGFSSYGWTMEDYDEVRKRLITGHETFWNKVEELL